MKFFKPKFWDKKKISFFSILLFPISLIIGLWIIFKNSFSKPNPCSIPIICIGNIYLGGTGKTPLCIEIFSILKKLNMNPGFVRKKYNSFQDEINLLKTKGPVFQNKKRLLAIKEAIKSKIDVVVLDDGFQDFSIKKNFSIVCFNEKQWKGNGFTIPSGPLRQSLSALKNAHCVIINGDKNINIENEILSKNNKIKIFYSKHEAKNIEQFKRKSILAFAGIGHPENFFNLLKQNTINVNREIKFPDHYNYSSKEIEILLNQAKENNSTLLTTEKDYFRIDEKYRKNIEYLKISTEIENKNYLIEEIKKII